MNSEHKMMLFLHCLLYTSPYCLIPDLYNEQILLGKSATCEYAIIANIACRICQKLNIFCLCLSLNSSHMVEEFKALNYHIFKGTVAKLLYIYSISEQLCISKKPGLHILCHLQYIYNIYRDQRKVDSAKIPESVQVHYLFSCKYFIHLIYCLY